MKGKGYSLSLGSILRIKKFNVVLDIIWFQNLT